jgi:6-phosphofructokinase 1
MISFVGIPKTIDNDIPLIDSSFGFIARNAALANGNVEVCLVPELTFELGGPLGLYEAILQRLRKQGNCVVVVAEGTEEGLINPSEHFTKNPRKDDYNKIIFDDICKFLKEAIVKHAKDAHGISLTLKYIEATYVIRSVPSNAVETIMCGKLAQNAVHGAMPGTQVSRSA